MFVVKKTISGNDYYYLRRSERKDGKVKAVTVAYLGKNKKEAEKKAKEIERKLSAVSDGAEIIKERDKKPTKDGVVKITYFVHGTTKDNEKGISTGQAQGELSELGIKQSKELAKQISNKKFDAIFSSDLKRAIDSARLTWPKEKIIWDKRLRECNYGDLNQAKEEKVNDSEHIDEPFPKGESLKDVELRTIDFLNFLYNNYKGKHVAIVAHKAPQLALDVLLKGKMWAQAIKEDWRPKKEWKPGWDYVMSKKINDVDKKIGDNEEKDFLSFVQEAGLVWGPEPEIYGGLAGFYTYGPLGKLLKNKVENSVRKVFNANGFREMEGPTVLPDVVWKASGHLDTFSDPVILTKDGKESYRADKLLEDVGVKVTSLKPEVLLDLIKKNKIKAPNGKELGSKIESYSLMMKTKIAGVEASLRPETATVTYLPFLRLQNYFRKKLPFGVFQIGKAYRNEISPRQSVLRGREFTQAEGQIFIDPKEKNNWDEFEEIKNEKLPFWSSGEQKSSKEWKEVSVNDALKKKLIKSQVYAWCLWLAYKQFEGFGIPRDRIRLRQHHEDEKAFYADDAWDIEVNLKNYGWFEMCGVHDRTDYDLTQHAKHSGVELKARRENGEEFVPHVLEIAFGTDRPTYALIDLFYEKKEEGEGKTMFKIPYWMAPIDVAIFSLMKKPELLEIAKKIKRDLEGEFITVFDQTGSIGRRYLRAASAGVPFAITIDYDSLKKDDVTIRDRDSEKQIRVKIVDLKDKLRKLLSGQERI